MSKRTSTPSDEPERIANMLRIGLESGREAQDGPPQKGPRCWGGSPIGPGTEIDGYRILEEVGRGGMGIVYRAKELLLDRIVAIKMLGPRIVDDPTAARRFQREARWASRVRHPNVVPIYGIDKCFPPRYFVMEFVEGESLQEKVERDGALDPEQAVRIATGVCKALNAAHKEKLLHLDIKPSNVLLENNIEFVKVTDFGIARDLESSSQAAAADEEGTAGTPDFTSPERKYMRKLDARADVFSLGMTLYFMLTGTTAKLEHPLGPAFLFTESEYAPPSRRNPKVSDALDHVVLRMISQDPRHRYRNCEVVLRELERICSLGRGRPIVTVKAGVVAAACVVVAISIMVFLRGALPSHMQVHPSVPRGVAFEPHHVAIQGANLTVFASNGQPIWSIGLDGTIAKAEVTRLFSDKGNYVVVGVGGNGKDGGKVLVYDAGGELVWDRRTDLEPYPYRGGTANRMRIEDVVVADLWQTGSPNIVTISNDLDWYASKVSVFDRTGMLKRIYWHPGQLRKAITFKPTNGGRLRILVFGCNNHMRVAVPGSDMVLNYTGIACLDPETLSGEAPPRRGTIGRGTELWYGLLFPQSLTINEIKVLPPAPGAPEGTSGWTIQACLSNCCFLYLDEDGKCVKVAHGDSYSGSGDERIELRE